MKPARFGNKDFFFMAIIIAWILAYFWLLTGERYLQFIEKDLQPLLVIALIISILFLIALVIRPSGRGNGPSSVTVWFNTGLLLLPLVYIYSVSPDGLDDYARSHRVAYIESTLHDKGRPLLDNGVPIEPPDDRYILNDIGDSMYSVSLTEIERGIDTLTGRHLRVIGRVSRDTLLPDGYFFIFRFVITCCAAHAMPMSLPVMENSNTVKIPNDEWIEILGTVYQEQMAIGKFVFDSIPVIYAKQVRRIDPPQNPYISSW